MSRSYEEVTQRDIGETAKEIPTEGREESSGSTSNDASSSTIRSIVQNIMESQTESITRIANEAVKALMKSNENKIADDIEERMRKKGKMAEPTFKHEGNKDQWKHQMEMWENMEDMEKAIERNEIEKAKTLLEQGKKLIQKRIKLIKIADREDWGTVKEYVSDDLASDTDDEKTLAKAIKQSAAKKEKKKKERSKSQSFRGKTNTLHRTFRNRYFSPQYSSQNPYTSQIPKTNYYKPQGGCWTCGKLGHAQWQCVSNQKQGYNR